MLTFPLQEVRQSDDHTRARGFVANPEDGEGRLSFNVNGKLAGLYLTTFQAQIPPLSNTTPISYINCILSAMRLVSGYDLLEYKL